MQNNDCGRIRDVDVAKGLLMLLVIISHINYFTAASHVDNKIFLAVDDIRFIYVSFFMPAFFVITGYCANFDKKYPIFLIKDIKTLLLPSITLVWIAGLINCCFVDEITSLDKSYFYKLTRFISHYWFLPALFWSKQIHYFIRRLKISVSLPIYIALSFVGCFLFSVVLDYWWILHSFMFVFFIFIGEYLKNSDYKFSNPLICILPYVVYIIVLKYFDICIPNITSTVNLSLLQLPFFLISGVLGTLLIFYFARLIGTNSVLEYIGKNSLVFYCLHFTILSLFVSIFSESLEILDDKASGFALIALFVTTIGLCALISNILNISTFKWLLGKF